MKTGLIHFHYENGKSIMFPTTNKYNTNSDVKVVFTLNQNTGEASLSVINGETGEEMENNQRQFVVKQAPMKFESELNVGTVSNVL